MKKTTGILSAVALALLLWAVALWLLPFGGYKKNMKETRYGLNEGMEVVEQIVAKGQRQYVVEDAQGNTLFRIPLRGCMIDTRFRGGRLRFREMATGREGYVDTNGMVTFTAGAAAQAKAVVPEDELTRQNMNMENRSVESAGPSDSKSHRESKGHAVKLTQTDIRKIAQSSPFYKEAAKILKGKLTETDASHRRQILNYCEHLRTAYTTKDIDFLRQVFSDEACALLKVVAPADFAFSSPLGIVERRDKVGEIWLFMPKGTKSITLKHPQWGVLRDYAFGTKLESRMTYEMRLRIPQAAVVEKHDTVVYTQTIVDTVTVAPPRRVVPWHLYTLLTASMHTDGPSWGAMIAVMSRHGGYVHASTNLRSGKNTVGACSREGYRDGATVKPYYSGSTHTSEYAVTAGLIHRINANFNIFEGAGYAKQTTAWQLAKSEGGEWLRNDGLTHKGVAAEIGVLFTKGRLSVSASTLTIGGSQWQGCVGIGIRIGKNSVITKPAKR